MNTTKKGDVFEDTICQLIKQLLDDGQFGFDKNSYSIYQKKGYYSKDREDEIVFDIAIEIRLPGESTFSLLILIECKDYSTPVSVDNIEEFYDKMRQVKAHKGIFASTNSFQKGAVKVAQSRRIGLLRYLGDNNQKWILTRSPSLLTVGNPEISEQSSVVNGLTVESYTSQFFDCYCCVDETYTYSLKILFLLLISDFLTEEQQSKIHLSDGCLVRFRDEKEIENIAELVLNRTHYRGGEVSLDAICKMKEVEGLSIHYLDSTLVDPNGKEILGSITFYPTIITIFSTEPKSLTRQRFTVAHELGHLFLGHSEYITGEYCQENDLELESQTKIGLKDIARMEWQANYFASCLLLPEVSLRADFLKLLAEYNLTDKGFGMLYLDKQQCNRQNYRFVTGMLMIKYKVSRTVVKIRLQKLGLLNIDVES